MLKTLLPLTSLQSGKCLGEILHKCCPQPGYVNSCSVSVPLDPYIKKKLAHSEEVLELLLSSHGHWVAKDKNIDCVCSVEGPAAEYDLAEAHSLG